MITISADANNPIQLVFPATHTHPATPHTTFESQSFLLGQIQLPATQLWIQGETVTLSPEGYFAHVVPLHDGLNTFYLETDTNHTHTCQILQAVPPLATTATHQSVFYKEASVQLQSTAGGLVGITPSPAVYQWGNTVTIQCLTLGEADVQSVHAHLTLGIIGKTVPLFLPSYTKARLLFLKLLDGLKDVYNYPPFGWQAMP